MDGWKLRLQVEYRQLKSRHSKIKDTIKRYADGSMSMDEDNIALIQEQEIYMGNYLDVLRKRCELNDIEI